MPHGELSSLIESELKARDTAGIDEAPAQKAPATAYPSRTPKHQLKKLESVFGKGALRNPYVRCLCSFLMSSHFWCLFIIVALLVVLQFLFRGTATEWKIPRTPTWNDQPLDIPIPNTRLENFSTSAASTKPVSSGVDRLIGKTVMTRNIGPKYPIDARGHDLVIKHIQFKGRKNAKVRDSQEKLLALNLTYERMSSYSGSKLSATEDNITENNKVEPVSQGTAHGVIPAVDGNAPKITKTVQSSNITDDQSVMEVAGIKTTPPGNVSALEEEGKDIQVKEIVASSPIDQVGNGTRDGSARDEAAIDPIKATSQAAQAADRGRHTADTVKAKLAHVKDSVEPQGNRRIGPN